MLLKKSVSRLRLRSSFLGTVHGGPCQKASWFKKAQWLSFSCASERERTPMGSAGVRATIPRSMRPPWPRVARSRSVAPRHARPRSLSVSVSEAGSELGDSRRQPQKKKASALLLQLFSWQQLFSLKLVVIEIIETIKRSPFVFAADVVDTVTMMDSLSRSFQ